ncbi:hypothetical protein CGMCC3_g11897 [Colletotrichum fructicola]|nr:uncharacterized protein CGMCC3_g11897 [Colletotrichum fructicola]KAE9572111.1 hypothetical protein CGMCC3_g11897 [Colletotrichum fructicola]
MKLDELQLSQTLLHIAIPNPGQLAYATPALRPSGAPPPASPPSLSKFTQRPFQDGGRIVDGGMSSAYLPPPIPSASSAMWFVASWHRSAPPPHICHLFHLKSSGL